MRSAYVGAAEADHSFQTVKRSISKSTHQPDKPQVFFVSAAKSWYFNRQFLFTDGNTRPELKKHRNRHFNVNCAGRLVRPCFFIDRKEVMPVASRCPAPDSSLT